MRNVWSVRDGCGRGFVLTRGDVMVAAALLFVVVLILASVRPPRETRGEPRSTCAANVRGIMQAMVVYASDNNGMYPTVPYAPYASGAGEPKGVTCGTSDGEKAQQRFFAEPFPQAGNVTAAVWMLVMNGQVGAKQFVCRSDPFVRGAALPTDGKGVWYNNFQSGKQLSYSMAYPWNAKGEPGAWWRNTVDAELPIVADMTPGQGTGKPKRNVTPSAVPTDGRTWNSGNHQGDGQNVGFADAHSEFVRRPDVGQEGDNIYAMSGVPSRGPARVGGVAAGAAAPQLMAEKKPFDVVMVPVRDESSGGMK
jgi:hypothetical protein